MMLNSFGYKFGEKPNKSKPSRPLPSFTNCFNMKNRTLIQSELWMIKWLKLYTAIAMKPLPPKSTLTFLWRVLPHVGPYQSQDVLNSNEQWFHEGKQKPSQTMTETKPTREKRQVTTLALLCSSRLVKTNSPSSLLCVQRILSCPAYNLSEFQCKERPLSFSCLESITRTDYPVCIAKRLWYIRVLVMKKGWWSRQDVSVH